MLQCDLALYLRSCWHAHRPRTSNILQRLHTITEGQMWIWQSVSQSVVSDLLGIFDSQDQVRSLMSSSEAVILAQWQNALEDERTPERCLMFTSPSEQTDAQSCTFPSSRCVFRGLGAHSSHPMWHLIKWGVWGVGVGVGQDLFTYDYPF